MNTEEILRALSKLPRPEIHPFFAERTTAIATTARRTRRGSSLLTVYWLLVAFIAGSLLMESWSGLVLLSLCGFAFAFPAVALGLVLRIVSPLIR